MNTKRFALMLLILPVVTVLCGFSFFKQNTVLVDTSNNHVYEQTSADDILSEFEKDSDAAKDKYKGGYYIISGKIEHISQKGDTIEIVGSSHKDDHIICSCPKNLRTEALAYNEGDGIAVFGKITVDLIDREIHLEADKLSSVPLVNKTGVFYLLDGTNIDKNSMSRRTLNNGTVSYYIPSTWKEVEHSIIGEELGTIEGYQYVLNKLPGNTDTVPESFFVCYFDNDSKLANRDEKEETERIEKAIIKNISDEGDKIKDVTTYYGVKYNYYKSIYKGNRLEYIFQKNGSDGLVMYLYVYTDEKHLSDVLFVTRFLEIVSK
ncbi:MAG: hypothetical protein IJ608_00630 [Lachnospiraceae bacterium]|nr:hypothetical protein [Lachnospiraceae bacterium]